MDTEKSGGKEGHPKKQEEAWKETVILIAKEFPGQFPGEGLYNLDIRDELRWAIEARRKQLLRDLSLLQTVNLGFSGGGRAKEVYNDMLNEYYTLEGIDRRREEIEANWDIIKMRG